MRGWVEFYSTSLCICDLLILLYRKTNKRGCATLQNTQGLYEVSLDHKQPEGTNLAELARSMRGQRGNTLHAAQLCVLLSRADTQ